MSKGRIWWLLARLRFLAVLAAIGGVIAYWDTINAHYEKWTRPLLGAETPVSPDSEYWCPMHPTIVRDHPDKCSICAMPLSKRKRGGKNEDEALPPGVVSRVQLTPYKVAVAGIETAEVAYHPLTHQISAVGFVEFDERKLARITAWPRGKSRIDKLYANVTGQIVEKGEPLAELYSPDLVVTVKNLLDARRNDRRDLERMNRDRLRLWGIDDEQIDKIVQGGRTVNHITIRSTIHGHIIKKYQIEGEYVEEGARLYDVADLSTVWIEGQVYEDDLPFLKDAVDKKLPVAAIAKGIPNRQFKGTIAFVHPHLDAATRTLTVRFDMDNPHHELRPGMYATVQLRVPVTQLDLLPPDANTQRKQKYQQGEVLAVPERSVIDTGNHKFVYREAEPDVYEGVEVELGPRCHGLYPVVRGLQAGERVVTTGSFLIDAETRLTAGAASTYFGASGGPQSDSHSSTVARPSMRRDGTAKSQAIPARVRTNLAKLSAENRRLAEEQKYCPIESSTLLGKMGPPVLVEINGQKVFLCCVGCKDEALAQKDRTLAKVKELRAKAQKKQ